MAYVSIDPYTQKEISSRESDSDGELHDKIMATHRAWVDWRKTSPSFRASLLTKLSATLLANKEEYAYVMVREMGKPVGQALAEVEKCALLSRYYATNGEEFLRRSFRASGSLNSYVRYDSQGVILGIMPWNFPFWQVFRYLLPALAGGNCVVLKHASNVTGCAQAIEAAVSEAGFPESVFRVLFPSHSQVEKLISMAEIRGIALTGSNEAGSIVASLAGKYIKKTVMELGGSDPLIVFPDADIMKAAEGALTGRFQNCGQSCIAAKRIIVHESVAGKFTEVFLKLVSGMTVGDPSDRNVFIGPMVDKAAVEVIGRQVTDTIDRGAKLMAGGKPGIHGPAFYEPTVLTDIPPDSPAATEELFGPVAPVFTFATADEAIVIANSSRFGLGASVWTADRKLATRLAGLLDSGTVAVNGFVRSDQALPFGGVKDSGYGRELSIEGFYEFLNIKSVAFY